MSDTTLTITPALKDELKRIVAEHDGVTSLNDAVLYIIDHPDQTRNRLDGEDSRVSAPIKINTLTHDTVQKLKADDPRATNYEAAIRREAGIEQRDTGEQPIDVRDL